MTVSTPSTSKSFVRTLPKSAVRSGVVPISSTTTGRSFTGVTVIVRVAVSLAVPFVAV
ncbi:hypothetical protein JNB88_26475 [Rhizobium cauense]|uniref:hypothetical protein n=1 Tax=Rhizobium cauense TaxID=1166683 RepID=UPI001C6F1E5C|nr:hypothetical protein [Rhizobium cauense]MBW9117175.1 hypothetical protein [Rhizobium cauense]